MIEHIGEQSIDVPAPVRETNWHKARRIARSAGPIYLGNFVNWEKRQDQAAAGRGERVKWISDRVAVLSPYMPGRHLETMERANLELFAC